MQAHLGEIIGSTEPMEWICRPANIERGERALQRASVIVGAAVCAFLMVLMCVLVGITIARAHGPAEWIQRGGYKNAAGELCCGERDCFELADGDVKITAAGYYVVSMKETIPFHEATPSPDGKYWRCQWGGARKCFFAPPGAS